MKTLIVTGALGCVMATAAAKMEHGPTYPSSWPTPLYDLAKLTPDGIALGRKLFYDPILSQDSSISCASCHEQYAAFATYDHALSHGYNNTLTTRNAPALQNLAWQKAFMWDGRIPHLEDQPLAPITGPNEMGDTMPHVLAKLRRDPVYRGLFAKAFGRQARIDAKTLGGALSEYMLTLISADSKYDRVQRGQAAFTLPERLGYAIFRQKCASCHAEPFFTDGSYRNITMTLDTTLNDKGRMAITGRPADSLAFKVPSLRNVALTFPYGHDGRYPDLRTVLERYRLTNYEIGQLKAFLYTLTDSAFLKDPRLGAPE